MLQAESVRGLSPAETHNDQWLVIMHKLFQGVGLERSITSQNVSSSDSGPEDFCVTLPALDLHLPIRTDNPSCQH